jgi:methyl-accepting chemotaxis protein
MEDKILTAAQEKLKSDLNVTKSFINTKMPGHWSIIDGKLYKGNSLIHDSQIVDEIKQMIGGNVTVFLADTRVATSVLNAEGKRAVGTKAAPEVVRTVMQNNATFIGKAQVVGNNNLTVYEPISDISGNRIGMLFVGVPCAPYESIVVEFTHALSIFVIVQVLVASELIYIIARKISRPIEELAEAAAMVATGNLAVSIQVASVDEIGILAGSMQTMVGNLRTLLQQVKRTTEQLTSSSEEMTGSIAGSIQQVAEGSVKQVDAVNKAASVVQDITATLKAVAVTADEMTALAAQTTKATVEGQTSVDSAVSQMTEVGKGANEAQKAAEDLKAESHKIGEIVGLISSIAGQTNLLALNAAIEAARAGEQGRGFAVVAEEVRKLAEQSEAAARQITDLIQLNSVNIDRVVATIHTAIKDVQQGSARVDVAGENFREINALVGMVSQKVVAVSGELRQASMNSQQIVEAIQVVETLSRDAAAEAETVSAATQEQSASMQEIAASSHALATLSEELQSEVARFQV